MSRISEIWGEGSMQQREDAILMFLTSGPIAAARIVLSMSDRGANGPERFLMDVEGFISDTVLWRAQARKKDEARAADLRMSSEAEAEERAAREGI